MSQSTTSTTELTSQYATQVAGDLERNVKEQERITAELAALQKELATLQHDHTVLVNLQQALGAAAPAAGPAHIDSTVVPSPRKKTGATRRPARTDTAEQPKARKRAATKSTAKEAAPKTAQPTLVELVRRHLTEQKEPRSAAEVAQALGQVHTKRGIQTNVVRTTLENLVARNQAQRSKQGASVFYTASDAAESTAAPTDEARPEPAE
ncbi:hypothetical protein [Streptomyces sp. NPDC007905]|uniref:hypothetical protein n=1 Tax=Streptomyces sp. NPDC007905 TaxID=3364788 RepID=UPI0036E332D8